MVLVIEIIIWAIGIVYGVITLYRLRKTKKEYEKAQREEVETTAEALKTSDLPKNDSGQEENYQRNETIDYLIELSDNSVPITLSSLIKTLYDEPGYTLEDIEKGHFTYGIFSNAGYKTISIVYTDNNKNYYDIYIVDSINPYTSKKVKLDDQVLIIRIEEKYEQF